MAKKLLQALLLVLLLCAELHADGTTIDQVVARVDNEIITLSAMEERVQAETTRIMSAGNIELPPMKEFRERVLELMVNEKLLKGEGERLGMSVEKSRVDRAYSDIIERSHLTEEEFLAMLEGEGKTVEEYKENIRGQILVSKLLGFAIKNRIKIDDKEIADYYDANVKNFWVPPKVHARHILFILGKGITPEQRAIKLAKAREAMKLIRSGKDFQEVAKKYSEDVSANTGGDLGILEQGKMVPEFEQAVSQLKDGETSNIVRTPYGLHIIHVDEHISGRTLSLDEVKAAIASVLRGQKFDKQYDEYLADLRKKAFVEIKLDELYPKNEEEVASVQPGPGNQKQGTSKKQKKVRKGITKKQGANAYAHFQQDVHHSRRLKEFQVLEKKLKSYKNLWEMDIITEEEYLHRKKELLGTL